MPKISLFFSPSPTPISFFLCLSGCLLVEFWCVFFFGGGAENLRNLLKKSTQHKDRQSTRRSGQHSAETCVTQHIVRGRSGTVHASRGRTFQERLCKGSGCCTTQHALTTAEPRRTNTASQGKGSITGFGSDEAAQERGRLFGPSATDFPGRPGGPCRVLRTVPGIFWPSALWQHPKPFHPWRRSLPEQCRRFELGRPWWCQWPAVRRSTAASNRPPLPTCAHPAG